MSGKDRPTSPYAAAARWQRWVSRAYVFAGLCLGALALVEAFDIATPTMRLILMLGIVAAGTAAWVMQAQRICPNCGAPYGYAIRIVNPNICRKCGAEFPNWRPGMEEDGETKR